MCNYDQRKLHFNVVTDTYEMYNRDTDNQIIRNNIITTILCRTEEDL